MDGAQFLSMRSNLFPTYSPRFALEFHSLLGVCLGRLNVVHSLFDVEFDSVDHLALGKKKDGVQRGFLVGFC